MPDDRAEATLHDRFQNAMFFQNLTWKPQSSSIRYLDKLKATPRTSHFFKNLAYLLGYISSRCRLVPPMHQSLVCIVESETTIDTDSSTSNRENGGEIERSKMSKRDIFCVLHESARPGLGKRWSLEGVMFALVAYFAQRVCTFQTWTAVCNSIILSGYFLCWRDRLRANTRS